MAQAFRRPSCRTSSSRSIEAQARQVHGNGLGLSLVKRIVAAHGGRVAVSSRPGAGTTFTIALPATDAETRTTSIAGELRATVHS
jgi:signal transduction histidine kinase